MHQALIHRHVTSIMRRGATRVLFVMLAFAGGSVTLASASFLLAASPATATSPSLTQRTVKTTTETTPDTTGNAPASNAPDAKSPPRPGKTPPRATSPAEPEMTLDQFLDRLMIAESGGNDTAKNPLSSATGAYQFIESTFIAVMQRHFPAKVEKLDTGQILALRTDRDAARNAAAAYTRDNATYLVAAGHEATFPHLRLAFLLGAGGASRILDAKPETPLSTLLGPVVMRANPWMTRHTAQTLVARAAREVSLAPTSLAGIKPRRDPITGKLILPRRVDNRPRIKVRCNLARPSCRRWLSLKKRQLARKSNARVAGSKP